MFDIQDEANSEIESAWALFLEKQPKFKAIETTQPEMFTLLKMTFCAGYGSGRMDQLTVTMADNLIIGDNIQ